jgi:all-trans-retinol 13,14-reductase
VVNVVYDVIVVGAGVSGLLSALMLSKEAKKVLVLEREAYVGGNARSYVVDGYQVDTGPHAITHVDDGPLTVLMNDYFDFVPSFIPYGEYYIRSGKRLVPFPWTVTSWVNFDILPRKDRMTLTAILGASITYSIFGWADTDTSLYDYLKGYNLSDRTWKFVDTLSYFMSGRSMREIPAWRMLKGARYLHENESEYLAERIFGHISKVKRLVSYNGAYHQAYPRQGVGSIVDSIVRSFPAGGVVVRTGVNVEGFLTDGGVVRGVKAGGEVFESDMVVYSGFARDMPLLTDDLPGEYVEQLNTLESSKSITLWLGLDKGFRNFDYTGSEIWFEEGKAFWAMPTTSYNRSFAPGGNTLVAFTGIVSDDVKVEEDALRDSIGLAHPGIWEHVVFEHKQVTIPEKAAITMKSRFPGPKTPVGGLFLVGTDADTRSMGVTRAAFSVLELRGILKAEGRIKQ